MSLRCFESASLNITSVSMDSWALNVFRDFEFILKKASVRKSTCPAGGVGRWREIKAQTGRITRRQFLACQGFFSNALRDRIRYIYRGQHYEQWNEKRNVRKKQNKKKWPRSQQAERKGTKEMRNNKSTLLSWRWQSATVAAQHTRAQAKEPRAWGHSWRLNGR